MLPVVLGIISSILGNKSQNNQQQPYQMQMPQQQQQMQPIQQQGMRQQLVAPQSQQNNPQNLIGSIGTIADLIAKFRR